MQETWVRSLGWEDPLEKGTATHFSILAWRIPWISPWGRKESDTTEWLSLNASSAPPKEVCLVLVFWLSHASFCTCAHASSLGVPYLSCDTRKLNSSARVSLLLIFRNFAEDTGMVVRGLRVQTFLVTSPQLFSFSHHQHSFSHCKQFLPLIYTE